MKEIRFQKVNGVPVPFGDVDRELWSGYSENQITCHKVTGVKKPRSYQQLKMFHAILKKVAENTEDKNWDTPEKAKFSLKILLHYVFEDSTVVDQQGNVRFQYRSFGYKELAHMEANYIFDRSWAILADVLNVSVDELLSCVNN